MDCGRGVACGGVLEEMSKWRIRTRNYLIWIPAWRLIIPRNKTNLAQLPQLQYFDTKFSDRSSSDNKTIVDPFAFACVTWSSHQTKKPSFLKSLPPRWWMCNTSDVCSFTHQSIFSVDIVFINNNTYVFGSQNTTTTNPYNDSFLFNISGFKAFQSNLSVHMSSPWEIACREALENTNGYWTWSSTINSKPALSALETLSSHQTMTDSLSPPSLSEYQILLPTAKPAPSIIGSPSSSSAG